MNSASHTLRIELESIRVKHEEAKTLLEKGMIFYFVFLVLAVTGLFMGFLQITHLVLLIAFSFGVLVLSTLPYVLSIYHETKKFNSLEKKYKLR